MAKFYPTDSSETFNVSPKKETIDFLLNYSKALRVINYNKLQFETILN
jgi:hypothetical protein